MNYISDSDNKPIISFLEGWAESGRPGPHSCWVMNWHPEKTEAEREKEGEFPIALVGLSQQNGVWIYGAFAGFFSRENDITWQLMETFSSDTNVVWGYGGLALSSQIIIYQSKNCNHKTKRWRDATLEIAMCIRD